MKVVCSIFSLFVFSLLYTQSYTTIKVIDSESNAPIREAKIISNNEIFYTNDDGNALIPSQSNTIIVSAISYEETKVKLLISEIKLSPIYRSIEGVEIKRINVKSIIEKVLSSYDKNYLVKTTVYKGTYKERTYIDNEIHTLLIADINLWTLNNKFNYRKEKMDSFVQMNLNDIRYYKTRREDANYLFSMKGSKDKNDVKSFVQRLFLYNQLYIMHYFTKNLRINGTVTRSKGEIQEIMFKSGNMPDEVLYYEGKMLYNKKDNAITYLEVNHIQPKTIRNFKNNLDKDVRTNTTRFKIIYDFIKEDGKYIPSKIGMDYIANIYYEDKEYPTLQAKEFIFRTRKVTNTKGLSDKIDLSKNITDNIITEELKEIKPLLSNEEKQFIDE